MKPADPGGRASPPPPSRPSPPSQYLGSLLAIGAVTLVNLAITSYVGYWGASITYLAAISLLAQRLGRGPVLLAAAASAALWDFVFISPRLTFLIKDPADVLMLGLYFLLALTSGWFTQRLRSSERALRDRERSLDSLSSLASSLAGASSRSEILEVGSSSLARSFEAEIAIFLADDAGALAGQPEGGWQAIDGPSLEAARRCHGSGRAAGKGADTEAGTDWHFAPLQSGLGVVGLRLAVDRPWTRDLDPLLATMLRTFSLALERERALADSTAAALAGESERLAKILIDSVSHELRTPLTIIQGGATALCDEGTASDPLARRLFVSEISKSASRLDAVVGNLLSMSRLESGSLSLHLAEVDQEELVSAAIAHAAAEMDAARLRVVGEGPPAGIRCDAGLVVQVLLNLLRNAAAHGPAGAPIVLRFGCGRDREPFFSVEDEGPGVPEGDLEAIFLKFRKTGGKGLGLGLAICKGIVEAHRGAISARRLPSGGFAVGFTLPGVPADEPRDASDTARSPV